MGNLGEIRENLRDELIAFGKTISPKTFKSKTPVFHYEIAAVLLDQGTYTDDGTFINGNYTNRYIILEAPRDSAKSTLVACFKVLHHCAYDEGNKFVIIQSKSLKEAKKRLRTIKNVLNYSMEFRALYGNWGEDVNVTWSEEKVTLRSVNLVSGQTEEWTIQASGTGQQIRGAKEDDQRITLLIVDDPEDENNTKTEESMESNFEKLLAAIPGVVKEGKTIVIGTPIHQLCMVERLMKMVGWVKKRYKSVDEVKKTSLWTERYSYEDAMAEKASLMSVHKVSMWYSERQCEITGDEDQVFREEDLRYWDGYITFNEHKEAFLHITHLGQYDHETRTVKMKQLLEEKLIPVNNYLGIDPASSERSSADYSVTMPVSYDEEENIYVHDYYEEQVKPTIHAEQIEDKIKTFHPKKAHVETVSYQEMLRDYLRKLFKRNKTYVAGLETEWRVREKKDDRLSGGLEQFTRNHKLYIKQKHHTLFTELVLFPRGRKNLLDGLWYATRRMQKPEHSLEELEAKKLTDDESVIKAWCERMDIEYKGEKQVKSYMAA